MTKVSRLQKELREIKRDYLKVIQTNIENQHRIFEQERNNLKLADQCSLWMYRAKEAEEKMNILFRKVAHAHAILSPDPKS